LSQTRTCLTAWVDYYTVSGYHHDEPGANYNAGFVIGKTMTAIALGTDAGADGDRLWSETLNDVFGTLLVGDGLGTGGVMVGGDWAEGWQYGPLSVLEYAAATTAVEEWNAPQPTLDTWASSLAVRYIHGTVPTADAQYVGNGDFDDTMVYAPPSLNTLDAVLLGPSSDDAAHWAAFEKQTQMPGRQGRVWNALAEVRVAGPIDYRASNPALWYLAAGTRAMYVRTDWTANAYWAVFQSEPQVVSDHIHFAASNFVFSRGADHLIVDSSQYGQPDTLATNAVTADSPGVAGDYAPSQTPWSQAELVWSRGTASAVYAARSDFAKAFIFSDNPSDIPYAHREWVMLPEGEVVTIDRVHTADATHKMYVSFHTNTGGGGLSLGGGVASGTVGGSQVTIHPVLLSGGTPAITQPAIGDCSGNYPFGPCTNARFTVDDYQVQVPGPFAVAVHVIDGGAVAEVATVGSMNDDTVDPAPKQNTGVIGAAVLRSGQQSYVVASSAVDGASPSTMTYGVPGMASRHVVYDAPEDASGKSNVSAAAVGGHCVITITAGGAMAGHPLIFKVSDATSGCTVTADTDASPATTPMGGGVPGGGGGTHIPQPAGCGCEVGGTAPSLSWLVGALLLLGLTRNIRRASRARE
jgi:MYXO-CTERM domain-containing protein